MRESDLYEHVARYMYTNHPDIPFHFDLSGVWTPSYKVRNLYGRLNKRAWPDFQIAKSTMFDGTVNPCAGLFLELKRDGTRLQKGDGSWASKHIAEQAAMLDALTEQGYYAVFAVGFEQAVEYIEAYLGTPADYVGSMLDDEEPF